MGQASWTYRDRSDEISGVLLNVADISAGGADFDAVVASVAALGAAILTCTECVQAREVYNQTIDTKDPSTPTDPQANREAAMRIFYADDTTGEIYHVSIPGPDKANMDIQPNTDLYDLADEPLATLVAAIESDALSPVGNAVTVLRAVVVGRRN